MGDLFRCSCFLLERGDDSGYGLWVFHGLTAFQLLGQGYGLFLLRFYFSGLIVEFL